MVRVLAHLDATAVTRDETVSRYDDLERRFDLVVGGERQTREEVTALRAELGLVASTVAGELRAAAKIATAERAQAVREARADCRQELEDFRSHIVGLTTSSGEHESRRTLIIPGR